jgi:hypothetical protein
MHQRSLCPRRLHLPAHHATSLNYLDCCWRPMNGKIR